MIKSMGRRKKDSWLKPDEFKRLREDAMKLTQEELSTLIDISARQISQMETGTQPVPKVLAAFMLNAARDGFKVPRKKTG